MYFSNSQATLDLPTPASPSSTTKAGRPVSSVVWNSSLSSRISRSRPVIGASSPSTRSVPRTEPTTARAAKRRIGRALPLSSCSPVSS